MFSDMSCVMKEVSAAELRQGLREIAEGLERDGAPVLLRLGRRPVGVIVSMRDFQERFALHDAAARRRELVEEILADRIAGDEDVAEVLRELRET